MAYTPTMEDIIRPPDILELKSGIAVMRNACELSLRERCLVAALMRDPDGDGYDTAVVWKAVSIVCDMAASRLDEAEDIEALALVLYATSDRPGNPYYGKPVKAATAVEEVRFDEFTAALTSTYGFPRVAWIDMPRWELEWYAVNLQRIIARRQRDSYESQAAIHARPEDSHRIVSGWRQALSREHEWTPEQREYARRVHDTLDAVMGMA